MGPVLYREREAIDLSLIHTDAFRGMVRSTVILRDTSPRAEVIDAVKGAHAGWSCLVRGMITQKEKHKT